MDNFCEKCGAAIDEKSVLCPNCDKAAGTKGSKKEDENTKEKAPKKQYKKKIGIIISILALVIVLIGVVMYFLIKNQPTQNRLGTVSFSYGFTDVVITDEESAIEAIDSVAEIIGITDTENELKIDSVQSVKTDTYYRAQQYYENIPVYGKTIVVAANSKGNATALTSNYVAIDEKINLKLSVEQDTVEKSIRDYFDNGEVDVPEINTSQLVIYCDPETNEQQLAYCIFVSSGAEMGDIIVDTKKGEVLTFNPCAFYESATVTNKSGTMVTVGWRNDDGSYHLYNDEFKISVFNLKKADNLGKVVMPNFRDYGVDTLYSKTNVFDDEAITIMKNAIDISNYYKALGFGGFDSLHIGYNEKYNFVENAAGGHGIDDNGASCGVIQIGKGSDTNSIDLLGHEYTHAVSRKIVNWSGDAESYAINEGYSDFFGELLEDYCWGEDKEMDWVHGGRIIYDPQSNNFPDSIDDENKSPEDYGHAYSTVISHAGYLMWNGIDGNSEKINSETLSELWYRTLFLMHSDVNYTHFRNAMELTARIMIANGDLTKGQYETILQAFERVGIKKTETYTYRKVVKNEFDLVVLNHNENEDVSYNLEIYDVSYKNGDIVSFMKPSKEEAKLIKEATINSGRYRLELENGIYEIRISDNYAENTLSETIIINIFVIGGYETAVDEVKVYTDFTDLITVVLNEGEELSNNPQQLTFEQAKELAREYWNMTGDTDTSDEGFKMSIFGQENDAVEYNGVKYYVFRLKAFVDNHHWSTWDEVYVNSITGECTYGIPNGSNNPVQTELTTAQLQDFENFLNSYQFVNMLPSTGYANTAWYAESCISAAFYGEPNETLYGYYFPNDFEKIDSDPLGRAPVDMDHFSYDAEKVLFVLNDVLCLNISESKASDNYYFYNGRFYYSTFSDAIGDIMTYEYQVDSYEKTEDGFYKIKVTQIQQEWGEGPKYYYSYYFTVKPSVHDDYGAYWKIKSIEEIE